MDRAESFARRTEEFQGDKEESDEVTLERINMGGTGNEGDVDKDVFTKEGEGDEGEGEAETNGWARLVKRNCKGSLSVESYISSIS